MSEARAMDETTRRLYAVGTLIEKIRRVGNANPIQGPELRSLAQIVAEAEALGERVVVLGGEGEFTVAGRMPVHPMAGA